MLRFQKISGIVLVVIGAIILLGCVIAYLVSSALPVLVATLFGVFPIGLGIALVLTARGRAGPDQTTAEIPRGLRLIQFWLIAQCLYASLVLLLIIVGGILGILEGRLDAGYFADTVILVLTLALLAAAGSLWILKRRRRQTPMTMIALNCVYYAASVAFGIRGLIMESANPDSPLKVTIQLVILGAIFAAGVVYVLRSAKARAYYSE